MDRFLKRVRAWFADRGIVIQRILTDNGSCYVAKSFAQICQELGLKHSKTRPVTSRQVVFEVVGSLVTR